MDSYRPDQPYDERTGDGRRREEETELRDDYHYRRDYDDATYGRDMDYRRRDSRSYGSRRQGYRDEDSNRHVDELYERGGRSYSTRMDYDSEDRTGGESDHRDRYAPQQSASYQHPNYSDQIRYEAARGPKKNVGEKDKCTDEKPYSILVITNLRLSLKEEELAKGLEKLYRGADELESGATPLSLRSVMIVKQRGTENSQGFGFAQYHTISDATAARKKSWQLGNQCTVSSQQFEANYIHRGVFPDLSLPTTRPTPNEYTFTLGDETLRRYWDERFYATQLVVNESPPPEQTKAGSRGSKTGSKRGGDTLESKSSQPKRAKKISAPPAVLPALQKWQSKQGELREGPEKPAEASASGVNAINTISAQPPSTEQTFAVDTAQHKACFLCGTKFSSSETVMRHLRESETHAAYAKDDGRKEKGLKKLEKNGIDPGTTIKLPAEQASGAPNGAAAFGQQRQAPQFRDRAAERRQVEAVAPAQKIGFSLKGKSTSGPPPPNRGREMLQKAGWTEGQGLGDGSGIAAPVEQSMYAAGVGLGHEGSKQGDALAEADRRTRDDRGDFAEMTKENARKRFERME